MRIYQEPLEMIKEVERDLFEMGVRYQSSTVQDQVVETDPDYQTIELVGYGYSLSSFDDERLVEMMVHTGSNVQWAWAELFDRIKGKTSSLDLKELNPGRAYVLDYEYWGQFLRDGVFAYTYAERWSHQLSHVVRELRIRPNTRQAMMTMYDVHQDMMNWGGRDRVPCSTSYQFILRGGDLTLVYNQRSCDFMKFFAADVFHACELLKFVAEETGTRPGRLIHFLGSLHAFAKDLKDRNIF